VARIELDDFADGTEIVRVYLAGSLAEAQAVERTLDAAGLAYAVEVEAFAPGGLATGSARSGAGFWVEAGTLDACAGALERAGHLAGLVDRG
jgi:hypothetical protein